MPKFYFHVRRGQAVYTDSVGRTVRNADGAIAHAAEDARAILRDEPEVAAKGQWMEIADEMGNIVRTLPFEILLAPTR